jgi:hypothetical protein
MNQPTPSADAQKRNEALVIAAAALVLADTIGKGMTVTDHAGAIANAFDLAEAFLTEAEKRLGGKLPL